MKRPLLWACDRPVLVGGLLAVVTLVLASQIPRLEIDASTDSFMKEDDPAREDYDQFTQTFGSDTLTIVLVKADDVFSSPVLDVIQRLSSDIERLDGVSRVESLTTVQNIKGADGFLSSELLVPSPIPTAVSDLQRLRADALASRMMVGNLVSSDGRATALLVHTDADDGDKTFNRRFSTDLQRLIDRESAPDVTLYQFGGPIIDTTVGDFILDDVRTFVPLSLGVLFALLFVAFRTPQGVVIPFVTGIVSIVWGLGLMAALGLPITVLTVTIPSLVLVIGVTEDVHMLSEYHELLKAGMAKLDAIRTTISRASVPALVTTTTTVLGFGSLVTSDLTMLIQFGYASALALTANFIVTVFGLPLMLRVWGVPRRFAPDRRRRADDDRVAALVQRLGEGALRHRALIAMVSVVAMTVSLAGWYSLRVNTEPLSFFPERSFIRERSSDLRAALTGFNAFHIVVESGQVDGIKDPVLLRRIAALQDYLLTTGDVDKTVSVADHVRTMHREINDGDPAFETIPETREAVAQYLLLLDGDELSKYVDFNASTASILVRHHVAGSWELAALLDDIRSYVARHFPDGVEVRETGRGILIQNAADSMAVNELVSLSSTFVVIAIIHALFFKSLKIGVLSMVPNAIPVLANFGLMGILDVPLNPGTAMIATIALGIAVDDTVHHVVTYWRELREHGDRRIAMLNTIKAQSRPIVRISLALAGGFLVLAFSNFVPTRQFGVLSAFVMLTAMATELLLTPVIMYSASSDELSPSGEVLYGATQSVREASSVGSASP